MGKGRGMQLDGKQKYIAETWMEIVNSVKAREIHCALKRKILEIKKEREFAILFNYFHLKLFLNKLKKFKST